MSNNSSNSIPKQFDDIKRNLARAINQATAEAMLDLADESLEICPMRTGELRKSLKVKKDGRIIGNGNVSGNVSRKPLQSTSRRNNIHAEIQYTSDHAICHEWDDSATNWTTPDTHSKFLENPAYHFDFANEIAKDIMKNLR